MCRVSGFYINSVFGFTQSQKNYSIALQTICKCIASGMQNDAKQRKAKQSKEKQIKQKQTKIVLKFVCKF